MKNKKNYIIIISLMLSAMSALIYEIVVTDILFFYFIKSSYSLATVLGVFLLGLGIGSLTIHFIGHKIKNKERLFGFLQLFIFLYAILVLVNLTNIIPSLTTFGTFITSFLLLIIPTIFLGAVFPLAGSLFKGKEKIGFIYAFDLFGAILGSLIAGFVLIPFYGIKVTIILAAILNLISSFIIFPKKYKVISLIFLILLLIPSGTSEYQEYPSEYQYYSSSAYGLVYVQKDELFIDNRIQCSFKYTESNTEVSMVNYAIEPIKKEDLEILNIGLGCGMTLKKALDYGEVDVVEINPKVVQANRLMSDVLKDENVNLIVDDGLNHLRKGKKYDSILIDIENPLVAHSSNLYTVEAFKEVDSSLKDRGTFVLWSYAGFAEPGYTDVLYYSLKEAFDYVYEFNEFLIASNKELDYTEYEPTIEYEVNSIDKKVLQNYLSEEIMNQD